MQNFYYDIPTKVFFGEGQIQNLPELVSEFGQRALFGVRWRQCKAQWFV